MSTATAPKATYSPRLVGGDCIAGAGVTTVGGGIMTVGAGMATVAADRDAVELVGVVAGEKGTGVGGTRGTAPILLANGTPVFTAGFGRVIGVVRTCGNGVREPVGSSCDAWMIVLDSWSSRSTPLTA